MTRSAQDQAAGVRASALPGDPAVGICGVVLPVPGPEAPGGPRLAGETLRERAVRVLSEGGVPYALLVGASPGPATLLDAALLLRDRGVPVVVVHDPRSALVGPGLVRALVDALDVADPGGSLPDGAVPVRPVTDTLKRVDRSDAVVATVDRGVHRTVHLPQAYRTAALVAALRADPEAVREGDPVRLLGAVLALPGSRVVPVEADEDLLTVTGPDTLELAEALDALRPAS